LSDFQIKGRTRASSTEGGGGNYGGDFAVNVPLIPGKLAIRGVAGYSELSGFIDSTGSGGQQRINDTEAQSYRLKVSYAPMDRLSIKLGLAASRIDNGATSQSLDNFTTPSSASPNKRDYDAYNLIAEYEWSGASLLSSTSYLEATVDGRGDFVLFGAPRIVVAGSSLQSFSQEFRLASHLEGPWQWSAGGIYTDGKDKISQAVLNFVFLPIFAGSPAVNTEQSESYAAFGEVTQSFDDGRFALTAGLRYFNDDYTTSQDSLFNGTTPAPGTTRNFSKTTGRLVFAYKPQEASAFYGSVATGFRSGQNQTSSVVSVSPDYPPTDPDSLITYELGAKGHLLDGALTYETAVYYMDWKDIQQSLVTPENFSARVNAGTASGAGVEATLAYRPTQALLLQASVGWNDLKLDEEIHSFPRSGGVPVDVILFRPGDRLNDSPEWTGSVGGSYRMATPMANVDFLLSTNFAYGSDRLLRALSGTSLDETYSDDFRSLKVSAGLQADRWSLDLYGDNLLDDGGSVSPPTRGAQFTSIRQRPRTIGLQVTFDF
jgi:iron complex outermembrane receptor protein